MKLYHCLLTAFLFIQLNAAAQKLISLEVSTAASFNLIHTPYDLQPYIEVGSGPGYMMGIGAKTKLKRSFAMRTGMQIWNKPMKASYPSFLNDVNGNLTDVFIKEDGSLRYTGFYFQILADTRNFFIGGGLDFSIYNYYKGYIKIYDAKTNVVLIKEEDSPRSGLTEKFLQQIDLQIIMGGKIWAKDKVAFKPFASFSIGMVPLFHSGAMTQSGRELNLKSVNARMGMMFEFALKGEVQPPKKKKSTIDIKKNKNIYELER
jgi:hypothetical protein